jgi:hypothetical protein
VTEASNAIKKTARPVGILFSEVTFIVPPILIAAYRQCGGTYAPLLGLTPPPLEKPRGS